MEDFISFNQTPLAAERQLNTQMQHPAPNLLADVVNLAKTLPDVIDLSVGDPNFTTPEPIIDAAFAATKAGATHYTAALGNPKLRQAIADFYHNKYHIDFKQKNVMITAGASHALLLVFLGMINRGDEVIVVEPAFPAYNAQVKLAQGVPVQVALDKENDYQLDVAAIEAKITSKTKAIVINYPNNPTGTVLPDATAKRLAQVAIDHNLYVISDEIYSEFTAEPNTFTPFARFAPNNTIIVSGMSKNFAMTGWRVGYIIAPAPLIEACVNINENVTFSAPTLGQTAALYAIEHNDELSHPLAKIFNERLTYLYTAFSKLAWAHPVKPQGSIYLFVNITATGLTAEAFTEKVLKEAGVLVIPGNAFGEAGAGCVRIAATQPLDKLKQAVAQISKINF